MTRPYPEVEATPDFPQLERQVLEYWKENGTFQASVDARPSGEGGRNEYVFYDGPPFANGFPHYGHLLTGYVKDIVPRYQTMRGRKVDRRFGWDCHGLPAELEAERQLGISGRQAIESYGIERFNDYCRTSVLRYTDVWEAYVTRQARWVDFANDYKTMDLAYMESVMWAFSQLWKKGLIYEGYRVMPYSWAAETPLSNFEIRMDNAYRPRQDPAITVRFRLTPHRGDPGPLTLLVWTTTPWTLPANLALAVGEDIEYGIYALGDELLVAGENVVTQTYEAELGSARQVGRLRGRDLEGRAYEPMFDYFRSNPRSFRVLTADFVDTLEGTGIVHLAPGFGEGDQRVCDANDIPLVVPVDEQGRFTAEVPDWQGQNVIEANKPIIQILRARGLLFRQTVYEHNYPHCWRTDQPLIYKAVSSWYVEVTRIRDRMGELNQRIQWIPERIRDGQFGKWVANARDWSISRNRFWGSPIPVWKSDDPSYPRIDVYGSLDEIARDFGSRPTDLHRPFVDQLTRPNPDDPTGRSVMRRVPEVLDCWFESGSMPFAQVHYPFENKEWFEEHFPADFIVEYVGQTRGWFYTLLVLATGLFDRPPFRNCMCHGVVLDENAQKLSKKLRNYPDPIEMCETYGSDALRWFLVSSPILRGGDLQIDKEGVGIKDVMRLVLNRVYNAWYFFTLYANSDGVRARFRTDSPHLLDRYILAKTRRLVEDVTRDMDAYDIAGACGQTTAFLDAMNNWYIRRSRPRFWQSESGEDKQCAYDTLYSVLLTLARVTAPLLPLLSEAVYRGLTSGRSVHLTDWPAPSELKANDALVEVMDRVRTVCSVALSLRDAHRLRTRLPLRRLTIAGDFVAELEPHVDLIREEVNVKQVDFTHDVEQFGRFHFQVNSRVAGKRLGKDMKAVLSGAKAGEWKLADDGTAQVGSHHLDRAEFTLRLEGREGIVGQPVPTNDAIVVLDTTVTPELEREGTARDVVRLIQQTRKEANLHIADHIRLSLTADSDTLEALRAFRAYIAEQTLADDLRFDPPEAGDHVTETRLDGSALVIGLARVP